MVAKGKGTVKFVTSDGTKVTFKAKKPRSPAKTLAAVKKRVAKLPEALQKRAIALWKKAHPGK